MDDDAMKDKYARQKKYLSEKTEEVRFRVKKGEKAKIEAQAAARGFQHLTPYIVHLLQQDAKPSDKSE